MVEKSEMGWSGKRMKREGENWGEEREREMVVEKVATGGGKMEQRVKKRERRLLPQSANDATVLLPLQTSPNKRKLVKIQQNS